MFSAIGLVVAFKASTNLAAAYGVAVTATMAITTMLMAVLERERWHWSWLTVIAVTVPFLAIDLSFFAANIVKIFEGGWFPLVVGITVYTLMTTWHTGRTILTRRLAEQSLSIDDFLRDLKNNVIPRVPGTAIFMSRSQQGIPITLLHNLRNTTKSCIRTSCCSTSRSRKRRVLPTSSIAEWEELGAGVYRLIARRFIQIRSSRALQQG
jgi:KUP system potassium uptake protein